MLNVRGRLGQLFDIGGRLLVVFDGHCGFCNGLVRWLIRRDRQDRLRFAALDSEKVEGVLTRHSLSGLELPTARWWLWWTRAGRLSMCCCVPTP